MVIIDRVVCDSCFCVVGQLFSMPAVSKDGLHDLLFPPFFTVCPDCSGLSSVIQTRQLVFKPLGVNSDV